MESRLVDKTVLIDDSDIDLFIQRRFLEVYNFSDKLIQYKSAEDALGWLRDLDGNSNEAPDVIFLDLNMPEIDGFSFLESFKQLPNEVRDNCKIVVLTSSNSTKDRDQAFTFTNVVQFITKPLKQKDIEDLKNLLDKN
ncbi:MAG: response regulator [Cyclobacteriaceae bacterium]|nr:response regulator [Cyclobacteriaceae bacterium]